MPSSSASSKQHLNITLISIAHRLQTVAFYDQILVLEAGQIAEFDYPIGSG